MQTPHRAHTPLHESDSRLDADYAAKKRSKGEEKPQAVRAIGEDDDGYDPYTDWHDRPVREPLFERDPWN